ncbi:tyrosine-type recombinase/integrase [Acinetobacter tibetensis]|uniref:Integrase arm-type DNA-binding domain-containing protein n=1 Tax=Acinetobacter tibetensis TaxID=2943497 RepID=A0AAE9LP00_9GAMM|nr:integrase arm-type DNA-binding domain-containing protein [Acinetobacter tibetensis]USE82006.1 integrase arm-type DNA-binding domain-containing protein [Acinetobacter tibetensis]
MLNDLKIKQLKAKEKLYRIADHSGLCIEVRPTGKKFWRFRYRFLNKPQMLTIGQYPEISLSYARSKVIEIREQLAKNIDPIAFKKNERLEALQSQEETFSALAIEYCNHKKAMKSNNWLYVRELSYEIDIFPVIGNKPIKDVTSVDIKNIMDNTLSRVLRSGKGTGEKKAILVRQHIAEVMQYAIISDKLVNDPTYALRGYIQSPEAENAQPVNSKDRKIIMSKIDNYSGAISTKNALKTLIYTMLRTVEIRRALKEYIDFEARTWTIPIVTKSDLLAGKRNMKKNRIHIVPLSDQVITILKAQFLAYPDSPYIFPGIKPNTMIAANTLNQSFRNMGLNHITMHDFRATASTDLNEANYNSNWIELQLAHVKGDKVKATYDHAKWLKDRTKMMQDWADIVDSWKE